MQYDQKKNHDSKCLHPFQFSLYQANSFIGARFNLAGKHGKVTDGFDFAVS